MKQVILLITCILLAITTCGAWLWMAVGFIVYLIKDIPFNFASIPLFICSLLLFIVTIYIIKVEQDKQMGIAFVLRREKDRKDREARSPFMKRMDDIMKQNKNNQ